MGISSQLVKCFDQNFRFDFAANRKFTPDRFSMQRSSPVSSKRALTETIPHGHPGLPIFMARGTIGGCPKDVGATTAIPPDPFGALL
jgi:hypothetical protein